jgi:L-ascorbate metabolism protein UlaG (beta-lactamase superfamily)
VRIVWAGHATVAITVDGVTVVTDPVLSRRVGHLRRVAPVPALPDRIDAVLLSHLHRDHLDVPSLRRIDPGVPVLAPRGSAGLLHRAGRREVLEMDPGERWEVGGVEIRATTADHPGGRVRRGARAWRAPAVAALGFVVRGGVSAYFAGDTGLFPGMSRLAGDLDVALLPVGGWHPRLGPGHLDVEDAAEALTLLRPRLAIPIHWGTYAPPGMPRGSAHLGDPGRLFLAAARRVAPGVTVWLPGPGDAVTWPP